MKWKRRLAGGFVGFAGFLLSPLSWWNDLFINVPLAVGFGWLVSLIYRPLFPAAVIVGYWLTNVLGFVLMHIGARAAVSAEEPMAYSKKMFLRDLLISLLYTALIVALIQTKLIRPIGE